MRSRTMLMLLLALAATLLLAAAARAGQPAAGRATSPRDTAGWFPFTVPWDDASATPLSAADLLVDYPGQDPATVIDVRGHVRAGPDGHFYFEHTGRRAKFWGVNLVFGAAFPPCPDAPPGPDEFPDVHVSDKLAAHLAKLGVNAVRFHHMDNDWSNPNATIFDYSFDDTQHFNAQSLARLDYLIYQLRRHGIYVDLNLHVSRQFHGGDGVRDADLFDPGNFNKNATLFDPVMIVLQKKYAHDLLTHVNPYTGLRNADDPAVLFTEITNEDSLFLGWAYDQLVYDPAVPGSLPLAYSEELDGKGINRLMNGGFEDDPADFTPWLTWVQAPAAASFALDGTTAAEGSRSLRGQVTAVDGVDWHVQLWQEELAVQAGQVYTVSFAARAARPTTVGLYVMNSRSPWNSYGLAQQVPLTTAWQWYTYTFTATVTDLGGARLSFDLGQTATTLWFDGLRFEERDRFRGWLGWLRDRHGSTAAIRAAWAPTQTVDTTNRLVNPSFEAGAAPWWWWNYTGTQATFSIDSTVAYSGTRSLKAQVSQVDGTWWHVQFGQGGLSIVEGQRYAVTFAARAVPNTTVGVAVMMDREPWDSYGLWGEAQLTSEWRTFTMTFTATASDDGGADLHFDLGSAAATLWFDAIAFRGYNPVGLAPGESLEAGNVARLRRSQADSYTPQRIADTLRFYYETERDYFVEMQRYVHEELGSQALNTGTASYVNNLADYWVMSEMDFADNHFYWDHPWWPDVPPWSPTGWVIRNEAWVNYPMEGLAGLAATAVEGRPFTVSEFNEIFPNRYAAEGPLLMAAFANHQDWDAVFLFDYADLAENLAADYGHLWFDLAGHPIKQTQMPVAARIFLQGQNRPATELVSVSLTADETLLSALSGWGGDAATFLAEARGLGPMTVWQHRLRVADFDTGRAASPKGGLGSAKPPCRRSPLGGGTGHENVTASFGPVSDRARPGMERGGSVSPSWPTGQGDRPQQGPIFRTEDDQVWTSDTGELTWDTSDPARGLVTVDAAQVQAAIGFTAGRTISLADVTLEFSPDAAAFNAVTLQSLEGLPISASSRLLLGVFTRMENTGMIWNADETSVDDNWGGPPTLVEPTTFTVTLTLDGGSVGRPATASALGPVSLARRPGRADRARATRRPATASALGPVSLARRPGRADRARDGVEGLTIWRLDATGAPVATLPYQLLDPTHARFVIDTAAQPGLVFLIQRPVTVYLPLVVGWNLISLPLVPPSTAVADVLAPIAGCYDVVYTYNAGDPSAGSGQALADPWKKYAPAAPPFVNDLASLDETMGFWVRLTAADTLVVTGLRPITTLIQLYSGGTSGGWNLIGYPSATARPVAEALASIAGQYSRVYGYDATDPTDPWKVYVPGAPPGSNDLLELVPGRGYWLYVTRASTLVIQE
jgi:hypothetical protein